MASASKPSCSIASVVTAEQRSWGAAITRSMRTPERRSRASTLRRARSICSRALAADRNRSSSCRRWASPWMHERERARGSRRRRGRRRADRPGVERNRGDRPRGSRDRRHAPPGSGNRGTRRSASAGSGRRSRSSRCSGGFDHSAVAGQLAQEGGQGEQREEPARSKLGPERQDRVWLERAQRDPVDLAVSLAGRLVQTGPVGPLGDDLLSGPRRQGPQARRPGVMEDCPPQATDPALPGRCEADRRLLPVAGGSPTRVKCAARSGRARRGASRRAAETKARRGPAALRRLRGSKRTGKTDLQRVEELPVAIEHLPGEDTDQTPCQAMSSGSGSPDRPSLDVARWLRSPRRSRPRSRGRPARTGPREG